MSRPRPALAKQLFPSSSPSSCVGDIRDQFKKPNSISSAAASASVSARTALDNRSVNLAQQIGSGRAATSNGSIASLYSARSDSFGTEPSHIDLTGPENSTAKKLHEPVYFAEEDFSDDDALDLDFEAPTALPRHLEPPAVRSLPPPVTPAQHETEIPWSSSPVSHFFPPNPPRIASATSSTSQTSLKRESFNDVEMIAPPTQKKVKKRVLPASFHRDEAAGEHDGGPLEPWKTPAHKTKAPWDSSASAIKEQKKLLKSQRNSRNPAPEQDADPETTHEVEEKASKSVAISLTGEQAHVVDMVVNQNQSVFFTGPAGAGKSVLMRAIINELKKKYARDPERVAVTASTGLAACNIGGITLHSFAGIGLGKEEPSVLVRKIRKNPKAKNRWLRTKCLIIDEISMVDGDLFDKLSQVGRTIRNNGRPWGGIQLVITGDFFQLPPVPDADKKRESKFAFDAATWSTSIDHTIGLTQVFRQRDPKFAQMLNEMRVGRISDQTVQAFKALSRPLNFEDGVDLAELYPTRAQVEGSNEKRLRDLPGEIHRYEAMDSGDPAVRDKLLMNMMAPKAIELKIGAQVMLIKNLDETLVNGSLGKVIAFSDEKTFEMSGSHSYDDMMEDSMAKAKRKLQAFSRDSDSAASSQLYPVVQFISTGGVPRVLLCQPEEWTVELPNGEIQAKRNQLPLILAWALSIHKAQGQTLERVTVNLGRVFEKGQAYVALSRATSQHGLRVLGFERSKVMAHPRVIDFYSKLSSVDDFGARKPQTIAEFISSRKGITSRPNGGANNRQTNVDLDDDEEALASYGC
ncbi:DNA helicase PIF1, ATP-dependent [Metarhizium album ARSEF 1941]|uniref:ATP-dependent DNA helicase PIF1 n=1 Tax=Metarhizium album (strain ARSEF 1941) TaxID=1081103 RepID=A0A0B2X4N9_METAS|nr:DNA helicase PIF1, ATP-dependent [Metarhizium album ARSEF 1941]KHO00718.1 DNA helicase PIF1, ATP-dependent [Metarhizium album ARSEF 1941]